MRSASAIPILAGAGAFAQAPAATPADSQITGAGAGTIGAGQTGSQPAAIGGGAYDTGGGTAETERIIVTGSNIPTAQEVGPNPVLNINRDLINKSGERTAEALIKDLPIANGGGVPISNNGTGFTPGASAISLRGLGPQETLLLIDGRRVAPYPIGNGGTSSFFDLRSIPEAAIESIEVLKDGASTTYGADAVAGVVNIKLRHDYKGVQAQIGYGNTLDKDSGEFRANVVFGIGDGNTNVTGVIDYYHRNSIFNRDRGYSAVPIFLSSNSTPENLSLHLRSSCRGWRNAASGLWAVCVEPQWLSRWFAEHFLWSRAVRFQWFEPRFGLHLHRCPVVRLQLQPILELLSTDRKLWWICGLRSQVVRRSVGHLRRSVLPECELARRIGALRHRFIPDRWPGHSGHPAT